MSKLPSGWREYSLGELCDLYQPTTLSRKQIIGGGAYKVYGANGVIGSFTEYNHEESQVLLSCRGNCGTVNMSEPYSWINGNAMVCKPKVANLDKQFLGYALQNVDWTQVITGTAQPQITRKPLSQVRVPLPSLDIQKRTVETLEDHLCRLDKVLDDVDTAKHHVQALFRSKRHEVFAPDSLPQSWEYVPISSVLTPLVGKRLTQRGWSPQCLNHTRTSDVDWGVLKTTAIQLGEYQPEHHKQLPVSLEAKPEIEVEPGDLIMTATGPRNRCGIPCLVQESPARLMMSGKMFRFRTDSSICDSRWLLQFLLSDAGQRQLENLKVGSSDSSVSIGSQQFENIELPLPPISAQLELLTQLDELTDRAKHFELAFESTDTQAGLLRRSLLHAAFTGQLTNGDSND